MGEPNIRHASQADVAKIRMLVDAAYGHYVARMGIQPLPMLDDYDARVDRGQAWVLEESGSIVGLVVLEDGPDGLLLLDNIAVAPAAQGQGHGRRLIRFAEAEARRRGCCRLELYTNALMTENIAMYIRYGFDETRRLREPGRERVFMAKELT